VDDHDSIVSVREKRGQTISQLLRSAGRIAVLTIAILLSLNVFINIGPLLGGAAVIGLAISFGAQSLVKDIIAGFFMLVEDQFALGDVIEAAGKSGVVEKITLRVVVLRDLDGTLHTVPNGEIKAVSNKTRGWSRAVVDVSIAYGEDVDRAIRVIRDEAERLAHDEELAALLDGVPEVWGVESVNDTATVVRMVAKTQPGSHWGVQREFRRRIKNRLDAEGIRTPAPRTVKVQVEPGVTATANS
jgi:small-conductance mechanosensitive channel